MKNRSTFYLISVLSILAFTSFMSLGQTEEQYRQLAKRLVQSASVKQGDIVVITGGRHMIPLMEDVAIEVQMAGGFSNMWLSSDRVQRAIFVDEPEQYLGQKNDYRMDWFKKANVVITLPSVEDITKLYEGVPETRVAKMSSIDDNSAAINALPVRWVSIAMPTAAEAKVFGVDLAVLQKMHWDAIGADYSAISARAMSLKSIISNAKQLRVTNPSGTDVTFSMVPGRRILIDDGIVTAEDAKSALILERFASLPGGVVSFAPLETSANGKVAVTKDWCRDLFIKDTKFEFKNGKVENYTAATNGKCFLDTLAPYTGQKDIIGSISIGLNPQMKLLDQGDQNFFPSQAEGLVFLGIGDNKLYGGTNQSNAGGWGWAIANATVTVDGKTIVKNGKLMF